MAGVLSTPHSKRVFTLKRTVSRFFSGAIANGSAVKRTSTRTKLFSSSSSSFHSLCRILPAPVRLEAAHACAALLTLSPSTAATPVGANTSIPSARGFRTRIPIGIGKTTSSSNDSDEYAKSIAILRGELRGGGKSPSSSSSSSVSFKLAAPTTDRRLENEDDDVESALSQNNLKRMSISKLLKKYRRNPDVQQQLKIAFADGYSFAEQKSGNPDSSNRDKWTPFSLLSKFGDLAWMFIGIWFLYYVVNELRQGFNGEGGLSRNLFNSLGPYEVNPEEILVSFDDVKGVDEAKEELTDVVEFLRDPERFSSLGGKMPHGVLLVGEPGVGKTLLAKAVAGEAGVPFFHAAGSEFDEIFVGTGAKRVRQLFASAKERAPAVIFIDEIDSVGGKRSSSPGHPYANQTINMLLSEMDGFSKNEGVIVIGATNKRDNLDKALIRPGRFDVEVNVYPPDVKSRKELFDLYISRILCDAEVDSMKLARDTRGFVGADIDNMVNQAAIRAGKRNASSVTMEHLNWARDKVSMGPEKKSKIPDPKVNWNTAIHEAGHALVAYHIPSALPIRKVTIMPRGQALGYVEQTPKDVMTNRTRIELLAEVAVAMGGKVAEEMEQVQDDVTSGCSSDLDKATQIARAMVLHYGMSDKLGVRTISSQEEYESLSNKTKTVIDDEIRAITDAAFQTATTLLGKHKKEHLDLAKALIKYETLDFNDVDTIMKNKILVKPDIDGASSSGRSSTSVEALA